MKFNIPKKFTGEAMYLKVFTKKGLCFTAIGALVTSPVMLILYNNWTILGAVLWFLLTVPFYVSGMVYYPKDLPYNGGEPLDKIILRYVFSWFNKRKIYLTTSIKPVRAKK